MGPAQRELRGEGPVVSGLAAATKQEVTHGNIVRLTPPILSNVHNVATIRQGTGYLWVIDTREKNLDTTDLPELWAEFCP